MRIHKQTSRTTGGITSIGFILLLVHLDLLAIFAKSRTSSVKYRIRSPLFFHFCGQKSFDFSKKVETFLLSRSLGRVHPARCRYSHGYRGRFRTRHILASLDGQSRILRARLAASIQSRILQARILQARLAASIQSRILRARLVASIQSRLAASSRARELD